jgi:Zn-dependent protease
MEIIIRIIAYFILLFAITIHESAHGWAALKFGDPTAYNLGRITLNPIPHIDPVGTVILPLIMMITGIPFIGWAKPVPVNPLNLRNPRRDNLWISAAGPVSNLTAALVFLIGIVILKFLNPNIVYFLRAFIFAQTGFAGGFHPLGGLALILFYGALINTLLAIFNMIPIPPLDGSGVMMGFLSDEAAEKYDRIRPYGFLIILGLLFIGFLNLIFRPIYILIATIAVA